MAGATIKIFLIAGTPLGPRTIEKAGWIGRGIDFARADWVSVRDRDDFSKPGVYVLTGVGDDGLDHVYVGEADQLRKRLNQHYTGATQHDFWTRAVAFVSKDEGLNKAYVKHLESRLVSLAAAAKRAVIENGNAPAPPALGESDRADAESFLEDMLALYPLVGIQAFASPPTHAKLADRLYLKSHTTQAEGSYASEGFTVYVDSRAAGEIKPNLVAAARKVRETLVASGVLVPDGDALRLSQDYVFTAPSSAASVMLGSTANGWIAWKDKSGKTLKEIQAAKAAR